MKRAVGVLILSALVLTSCGTVRDSRLNPFNWFGRGSSERVVSSTDAAAVNPLIPRGRASVFRTEEDTTYRGALIGEVSELLIERRPGGAIVRATGIADRQGPWEVRLVKDEAAAEADTLTYDMRAYEQARPVGAEPSRTVTTALWLSDNDLLGIRTIRVRGARNAQVSRR